MRITPLVSLALSATTFSPMLAQEHGILINSGETGRTFALVQDTDVSINGYWQRDNALDRYAHAHPGHYIVFLEGDQLHRLDNAADVAEAERAYAPMLPLQVRQRALAAEQKPLAEQQRALAAEQRAATGNPTEQGRIGQAQGRLGQQQGELGRQQGEIGKQQGEIGRAFYGKVQTLLTACLANNTCPKVTS